MVYLIFSRNDWQYFEPYSNILWLHYLLDKMENGLRYKNVKTKVHQGHIQQIKKLKREILSYASAVEFVEAVFL